MNQTSLELNLLLDKNNNPVSQTQDMHIAQFNRLGKTMASCADYYAASKSGDASLIARLRKDLDEGWIIAGDRIAYESSSLNAVIVSPYGIAVSRLSKRKALISVYNGETLDSVLANEQGLLCIQTLFNTTESAGEIKNILAALSGKNSRETKLWTPDQNSRRSNPIRAAVLCYGYGGFHIYGNNYLVSNGRAHVVSHKRAA